MQEKIKFYMITILKDKTLFANIYENHDTFLNSLNTFKKYPFRTWELNKTYGDKFDLVISKEDDKFVACLNPTRPINDSEPEFIKCVKKEIDVSKL